MQEIEQAARATSQRKRAVIYCRVSTDKQEQDGESLEYQEEKCRRYADMYDIDIVVVLREAKSGFIHYSHREQLTLARQLIRDRLADMVIVWDLRRFSRNFVHSAMIFEEIEAAGGIIVSVSENIDNTLTGKLVRSILAWSAESEREKILEYANRRWQTRIELGLPVGTGFASYGWEWGDKEKTFYVINPEEAAVRFSIFQMFVELDMSLRGIAHKLTEDGIPTATQNRNPNSNRGMAWAPVTLHDYLKDKANIGFLEVCKERKVLMDNGSIKQIPHPDKKEVPGGIPAIVPVSLYERAQQKLATNREEKSRMPRNPREYLLKGHVYCATCGYKMGPKEHKRRHYYYCRKFGNNHTKCPDAPTINTNVVDKVVWDDCCQLFERLDGIQAKIEQEIARSLTEVLEDTKGKEHIAALTAAIDYARQERAKHLEGSYYYTLITQDLQAKVEQLQRYQEECAAASNVATATATYKERVMEFLDFVNAMHGKYHNATFQEKRNALDVLGVKVFVRKTEDGEFGKTGFPGKAIEVTYSPLFTGVHSTRDTNPSSAP